MLRSVSPLLLSFALLAGCGSYRPKPSAFVSPAARESGRGRDSRDWDEVLARPAKVSLETLETGKIRVSRGDLIDRSDPRAAALPDDELWVPVFAHLVRHDDGGDFLIDAGLDRAFQTSTSGDLRGVFAFKVHAWQRSGADVVSQLEARHVTLRGIFFTHLHPDHVSGATSLPRDLRYVVGKDEPMKSASFLFWEDALAGVRDFEEIDFRSAPAIAPLGPVVDLFGDGSVWAISTPGHTVGHISYLVVAKGGPVLLTGDASHTRWGFEHGVAPGGFNDGTREDAVRSLGQLRAFAARYPTVRVVLGHEL